MQRILSNIRFPGPLRSGLVSVSIFTLLLGTGWIAAEGQPHAGGFTGDAGGDSGGARSTSAGGIFDRLLFRKRAAAKRGRLFIASDRATLRLSTGRETFVLPSKASDHLGTVSEDEEDGKLSREGEKRIENNTMTPLNNALPSKEGGKLSSAFFTDSGQDSLTWLSTEDGVNFAEESGSSFLNSCRGKKVVLFVHGCCVSFKEMEGQARDMEAGLRQSMGDDVVLLAYDWATPAWLYPGSLKNMETTQIRFVHFMETLRRRLAPGQLSVVMHSLGGNLMVRYLTGPQFKTTYEGGKVFDTLIFSRPDMSMESFRPHLAEVAATAERSIVLAAENDVNINLSGFVRSLGGMTKGSYRLGQMHNARELSPQLSVIDVGALNLGHKIPYTLVGNLIGKH